MILLTWAGDGAQPKAHALCRLKFGDWGGLDGPEARLDRGGPYDGGVTWGGQHGRNDGGRKGLRLQLILLQLQVSGVRLQGLRQGGCGAHVVQILVVFWREEGRTRKVGCNESEYGAVVIKPIHVLHMAGNREDDDEGWFPWPH